MGGGLPPVYGDLRRRILALWYVPRGLALCLFERLVGDHQSGDSGRFDLCLCDVHLDPARALAAFGSVDKLVRVDGSSGRSAVLLPIAERPSN